MPRIQCECRRTLTYRPDLAGKVVKCPGCAARIRLPEAEAAVSPAGATPDEGQELQLETNAADAPLAVSVPTSDGAASRDSSFPAAGTLVWPPERGAESAAPDPAATQDYWGALPGAFAFPLKGEGFIALIVGVIFVTVAGSSSMSSGPAISPAT